MFSLHLILSYKMEDLQHFYHDEHPLVFNENERSEHPCYGCQEPVYGPSYSCIKCKDMGEYCRIGTTFFINHVPNYPLGCIIPCIQNIFLFSFPNGDMMSKNFLTKMENAKSAQKKKKKIVSMCVFPLIWLILCFMFQLC